MFKAKIYVIIVIYNKSCSASITCRCLKDINNINVIIVDNSTIHNDNTSMAEFNGWKYIDMYGNKGLAKAYNRAIESIKKDNSIICLFDDDTEVNIDYFNSLSKQAAEQPDTKIFLPLVYDEIGLLSPSIINDLAVKRVNSIDEISSDKINGINSGMAIKGDVFDYYKYDEKYFLDYIDHAFLRDMKKNHYKIAILNARLNQAFFANTNTDLELTIKRFKIFKKDFKRFCGKSLKGHYYYFREITNQKKQLYLKNDRLIKLLFI